MMESKTLNTLIQIHLVNGVGYSNATYGIVNGVMYLTSGRG